jgi:hypothetical protein
VWAEVTVTVIEFLKIGVIVVGIVGINNHNHPLRIRSLETPGPIIRQSFVCLPSPSSVIFERNHEKWLSDKSAAILPVRCCTTVSDYPVHVLLSLVTGSSAPIGTHNERQAANNPLRLKTLAPCHAAWPCTEPGPQPIGTAVHSLSDQAYRLIMGL